MELTDYLRKPEVIAIYEEKGQIAPSFVDVGERWIDLGIQFQDGITKQQFKKLSFDVIPVKPG